VLPQAIKVTLPCALITLLLKYVDRSEHWLLGNFTQEWHIEAAGFTTFSGLLGFLIVFRTSEAYSRYWEGCGLVQVMMGNMCDAAFSIASFTSLSKARQEKVWEFRQTIVALTSLLNASCFLELAGPHHSSVSDIEVVGLGNFNAETKLALQRSRHKVHLVYYWWMCYVSQAIDEGILDVPAPLLSCTFGMLASSMVNFENCYKLSTVPLPLNYTQATLWLLAIHWMVVPLAVISWTQRPSLAFLMSFVLVFIFSALFFMSEELEEPFGDDVDDIDVAALQSRANDCLLVLLTPEASSTARFSEGCREGRASVEPMPMAEVLFSGDEFDGKGMAGWHQHGSQSSESSLSLL